MPDFDAFQVFTLGAALGIATGLRLGYAVGWLLSRPLPRPWRAVWRWYRGLWRDTVRLTEDFAVRWDARHPASADGVAVPVAAAGTRDRKPGHSSQAMRA